MAIVRLADLQWLFRAGWYQRLIAAEQTTSLAGGHDWRGFSLTREKVLPIALEQLLKDHPGVKEIHLHLDNDDTGRGASLAIKNALEGFVIYDEPPETGKDVNEWLTFNSHYRER